MARSGWVAVAITTLLVAGLGSQPAVDQAADANAQVRPLLSSLTTFPAWSTSAFGGGSDMVGPIASKVILLLVVVFIGTGISGQVGSATASFLAGWGTVMVGAALAGGVFLAAADAFALDGALADSAGGALPLVVGGFNDGVQFGLYTGWLVGLGVVVTARAVEPEPGWVAPVPGIPGVPGPPVSPAPSGPPGGHTPPGSAPGYPTVYPQLPSGSDWSGPLTQPVQRPQSTKDLVESGFESDADSPGPPTRPVWPSEFPGSTPGGAYTHEDEEDQQRPNWTRWSDRSD